MNRPNFAVRVHTGAFLMPFNMPARHIVEPLRAFYFLFKQVRLTKQKSHFTQHLFLGRVPVLSLGGVQLEGLDNLEQLVQVEVGDRLPSAYTKHVWSNGCLGGVRGGTDARGAVQRH